METKSLSTISDSIYTVTSFKFFSTCNFNGIYDNSTDSISLLTRGMLHKPGELKLTNWGKICTNSKDNTPKKRKKRVPVTLISVLAKHRKKQPLFVDTFIKMTTKHNLPILPVNLSSTGYIPVSGGKIHLQFYSPKTTECNYPVSVCNNWDGWVTADLNT